MSTIPRSVIENAKRYVQRSPNENTWEENDLVEFRERALDAIRHYKVRKADIQRRRKEIEELSEWLKSIGELPQ